VSRPSLCLLLCICLTGFLVDAVPISHRQDSQAARPGESGARQSKIVCSEYRDPKSGLPLSGPQCAEKVYARWGMPVMSPAHDGIAFGISSPPGKPMTVSVWMDNETEQTKQYLMCCRLTFLEAIDVFDSEGNRLLSTNEQSERKTCSEGKGGDWTVACTCSALESVAPHTMEIIDSGDLSDGYVLAPGRYFVAPANIYKTDCTSLSKLVARVSKSDLANAITVVIPQKGAVRSSR
jgi:hypothetical protein